MKTQDHQTELRAAILEELYNTPQGYMQSASALHATISLALFPPPGEVEVAMALARLENDLLISRVDSTLRGARYAITDAGRAAMKA